MARLDFKTLAAALLSQARHLVPAWFPDGRFSGAEYQPINPKRADAKPGSFCINVETGVWKDFADGEGGGDLISLYAWLHDLKQAEAAKALADLVSFSGEAPPAPAKNKGGRPVTTPIFPVPPSADPLPHHSKYGKPSKVWAYHNHMGDLLWYVCRYDPPGEKKQFCPLTWQRDEKTGVARWTFKGPPAGRVVYKLDQLILNSTLPVCIAEGEKAADAAAELMPGFVTIASMGGAQAWKQTDWRDLRGRSVVIWPDNDPPGAKYAVALSGYLLNLGVASLQLVRIPPGKPEGWDAADALAEGWTAKTVLELIEKGQMFQTAATVKSKADPVPALDFEVPNFDLLAPPWPTLPNWTIDQNGVRDYEQRFVCMRPAWISALTQNLYNEWGIQIRFFDHNWEQQSVNLPAAILSEQGGVLGRTLQALGMGVIPGKEKNLARYFAQQQQYIRQRVFATSRLGWYDNKAGDVAFLLPPDRVIGKTRQEVVYQPEGYSRTIDNLRQSGTLGEWQTHIRDNATGNPFLMFSIMCSMAGPLLKLCRVENGGFHLYGLTTGGKTTAAQAGASVWGSGADPQLGPDNTIIQSWDATANALENQAEILNDLCMCLDEIGKADPMEVSRSIYKITGGMAKSRATLGGQLRPQKTWRLLLISTGEVSLRQVFASVGLEMKAGQRLRFPDIPVDDDKGKRAIIQDLHGMASAEDFSQMLKTACATFYGTAGPVLVEFLVKQISHSGIWKFMAQLADEMRHLEAALNTSKGADGKAYNLNLSEENRRVVRRFAAVAAAGYYGFECGVLNWDVAQIIDAIRVVRDAWLSEQGETRNELDRGISFLAAGIGRNVARFVPMDAAPNAAMRDVLGFRSKDAFFNNFFVLAEESLREMCGPHDAKTVLRELRNRGLLLSDEGKLTRKCPAIPSLGNARPYRYWISAKIFGDEEPDREALPDPEGLPF